MLSHVHQSTFQEFLRCCIMPAPQQLTSHHRILVIERHTRVRQIHFGIREKHLPRSRRSRGHWAQPQAITIFVGRIICPFGIYVGEKNVWVILACSLVDIAWWRSFMFLGAWHNPRVWLQPNRSVDQFLGEILQSLMDDPPAIPSGKLTVCYWKWHISSWFTH